MTSIQVKTRQRNMRQLWMLVALFALPPIAAWLFYFNPQWLPEGRTNHGRLIDPPTNMQPLSLLSPEQTAFDWAPLQERWTLTVMAEGRCDEQCTVQLIKLRQIRRALGANRQRVERLLILLPDTSGDLQIPTLDGLEGTRLAIVPEIDKPAVQALYAGTQKSPSNLLFLIDPRVDLMMVHDMSRITSKQILQDLEKLLKASQNWAKGGQYGHQ
jgi:cytochrome oxidase Cu insertion factor (SCO1/SenC/PrrC family)